MKKSRCGRLGTISVARASPPEKPALPRPRKTHEHIVDSAVLHQGSWTISRPGNTKSYFRETVMSVVLQSRYFEIRLASARSNGLADREPSYPRGQTAYSRPCGSDVGASSLGLR
jgi:hypothetical protein